MVSAGPDEFDLNAAWLRRSQTDLRAFMAALAARLEGALPGRVSVERRRDGLLSKTSHVARISLKTERAIYELALGKAQLSATRAKLVRGVTISSAAIAVPEWLAEVRKEVQALAEQAGVASDVLQEFL
jgi:hypothetical protein